MKERIQQLPADGKNMSVFITHPEEEGPFPVVILYMDIWGVREELYDLARRIATVGYYCMVPDFYYRQGPVRTDFRNADGKMISVHLLNPEQRLAVIAPLQKLSDEMVMEDTAVVLEFLKHDKAARGGAMGCIGYCLGGRHVLLAGARFPDRFQAMGSMHPTAIVTDKDDSPHLLASRLRGEIYFGLAELDRHSQPAMVETLTQALGACEVAHRIQVHKGVDHGYALPDRDIHDKAAFLRDWEYVFAMFRRRLGR